MGQRRTCSLATKGMLLSDYGKHPLLPEKEFADFQAAATRSPRAESHHAEWLDGLQERRAPRRTSSTPAGSPKPTTWATWPIASARRSSGFGADEGQTPRRLTSTPLPVSRRLGGEPERTPPPTPSPKSFAIQAVGVEVQEPAKDLGEGGLRKGIW